MNVTTSERWNNDGISGFFRVGAAKSVVYAIAERRCSLQRELMQSTTCLAVFAHVTRAATPNEAGVTRRRIRVETGLAPFPESATGVYP